MMPALDPPDTWQFVISVALAGSLPDMLEAQEQMKALGLPWSQGRRGLFGAQDVIDRQRDGLIGGMEGQLRHTSTARILFSVCWRIV